MSSIALANVVSLPWTDVQSVCVGDVPGHLPTPDQYATIAHEGNPLLRIDVYAYRDDAHLFQDATLWEGFSVIGFGHRLYLVNLSSRDVLEFNLEGYFGHMQTCGHLLLIASARHVFCVGSDGKLHWRSTALGIDGVVFHEINEHEIRGAGEWDPPRGWKAFRLATGTGVVLPLGT